MITSLRLIGFKNFADETLHVGPFTVIVGENASGKSNIRDAFRFLHGVGRGYTLAEILGGRYGAGGHPEWGPIRGAPNEIGRVTPAGPCAGFALAVDLGAEAGARYLIEVRRAETGDFRVVRETLTAGRLGGPVYTSHPDWGGSLPDNDETHLWLRLGKTGSQKRRGSSVAVRPGQPALTQIGEHDQPDEAQRALAKKVVDVLARMRFLDLVPDRMRQPSFPGQRILSDSGDNLPTVLRRICDDPRRRATLIEWVRALTPMDVDAFQFPLNDVTGQVQLVVLEKSGKRCSAHSMSDGTLRFLAMLAVLLADDPTRFYFFEEIDNGIHPGRQWLLLELIEKHTATGGVQVVTTTHAPALLTAVNDNTFQHTSVVCRPEDAADAIIRSVADLPNAGKLRTSHGLGRLLTGGWMEDMIAFTAAGEARKA